MPGYKRWEWLGRAESTKIQQETILTLTSLLGQTTDPCTPKDLFGQPQVIPDCCADHSCTSDSTVVDVCHPHDPYGQPQKVPACCADNSCKTNSQTDICSPKDEFGQPQIVPDCCATKSCKDHNDPFGQPQILPFPTPDCGTSNKQCKIVCQTDSECQNLGFNRTENPCSCPAQVRTNDVFQFVSIQVFLLIYWRLFLSFQVLSWWKHLWFSILYCRETIDKRTTCQATTCRICMWSICACFSCSFSKTNWRALFVRKCQKSKLIFMFCDQLRRWLLHQKLCWMLFISLRNGFSITFHKMKM